MILKMQTKFLQELDIFDSKHVVLHNLYMYAKKQKLFWLRSMTDAWHSLFIITHIPVCMPCNCLHLYIICLLLYSKWSIKFTKIRRITASLISRDGVDFMTWDCLYPVYGCHKTISVHGMCIHTSERTQNMSSAIAVSSCRSCTSSFINMSQSNGAIVLRTAAVSRQ